VRGVPIRAAKGSEILTMPLCSYGLPWKPAPTPRAPADRFHGGPPSPSFQNRRRTTLNSLSRVGRGTVDNFGDDWHNPLLQILFLEYRRFKVGDLDIVPS
jgi:hypothetical protein